MGSGKHKNKRRSYCSDKCIKTAWRLKNPDKQKQSEHQWLQNNPEKRKEASSLYRKKNKAYYAEYRSVRSRAVKQAQPIWADTDDIKAVYLEAEYFQLEVDHIIPLKHPLVCGLHVWNNLQLLSRSENAKKSNKFDQDVLCIIE